MTLLFEAIFLLIVFFIIVASLIYFVAFAIGASAGYAIAYLIAPGQQDLFMFIGGLLSLFFYLNYLIKKD